MMKTSQNKDLKVKKRLVNLLEKPAIIAWLNLNLGNLIVPSISKII